MEYYLCGRAKCCPYLIEDIYEKTLTIKDGRKKIILQEEEIENLRKYLNERHG